MIPSIEDRLSSMQRALEVAILPALPEDQSLAIEQAHLLIAHLGLVREQLDFAALFEQTELKELERLGEDLTAGAAGGSQTTAAAAELGALIQASPDPKAIAVRERIVSVSLAIEKLLAASGVDGSDTFRVISAQATIAYSKQSTLRDRSWFRSTGFERGEVQLPAIEELLSV